MIFSRNRVACPWSHTPYSRDLTLGLSRSEAMSDLPSFPFLPSSFLFTSPCSPPLSILPLSFLPLPSYLLFCFLLSPSLKNKNKPFYYYRSSPDALLKIIKYIIYILFKYLGKQKKNSHHLALIVWHLMLICFFPPVYSISINFHLI